MKLTPAQESAIKEAALVELRTPQEMLSLLLVEGLRFYFAERCQQWYRKADDGSLVHFKEDEYMDRLVDELMETCQVKEFISEEAAK